MTKRELEIAEEWRDLTDAYWKAESGDAAQAALEGLVAFVLRSGNELSFFPLVEVAKYLRGINEKNKKRNARLDALEARLAVIEARPDVEYRGVFTIGKTYEPGHLVTRNGALWLCTSGCTTTQPSADPSRWKLIVKSGGA